MTKCVGGRRIPSGVSRTSARKPPSGVTPKLIVLLRFRPPAWRRSHRGRPRFCRGAREPFGHYVGVPMLARRLINPSTERGTSSPIPASPRCCDASQEHPSEGSRLCRTRIEELRLLTNFTVRPAWRWRKVCGRRPVARDSHIEHSRSILIPRLTLAQPSLAR